MLEVDMRIENRPIISPVGSIYTTADTATLMQVSVRTVQRLIRDRKLRSHKVGRVYRILGKDIEAFFGQQDQAPTDEPTDRSVHGRLD
jgi:excisionase family DNA binding protein